MNFLAQASPTITDGQLFGGVGAMALVMLLVRIIDRLVSQRVPAFNKKNGSVVPCPMKDGDHEKLCETHQVVTEKEVGTPSIYLQGATRQLTEDSRQQLQYHREIVQSLAEIAHSQANIVTSQERLCAKLDGKDAD